MKKKRGKLGVWVGIFLISLYQVFLRPFVWSSCRFEPSCSVYTQQAIQKYGFWKGVKMGLRRIRRCNPLNTDDPYDPVE